MHDELANRGLEAAGIFVPNPKAAVAETQAITFTEESQAPRLLGSVHDVKLHSHT